MRKEKLKTLIWIMILGIAVIGAFITYLINGNVLKCLPVFVLIFGIGISFYAFFIERSNMGNLAGGVIAISSFIVLVIPDSTERVKPIEQRTIIILDSAKMKEYLDENMRAIYENTIDSLNKELSRKDLSMWEQDVKDYLEKGELQKAIESIDTDAGDEEAARKHIRKAQLYIVNFQFTEAEQHYKKAVVVFPSYDNNFAIARFYDDLNKFPEAIAYYSHCLSFATSPQEKATVFSNMGSVQWKNNAYREAEASLKEALKIRRELAVKNRNAYLPDVATTLNNLGNLYYSKKEYSEAETSYKEALRIRRELAVKNRDVYLPYVAGTLNNLGNLHQSKKEYSEAKVSYEEALKIYRELLNNLSILLENKKEYSKAEVSYKEALKKLAAKNQVYLPDIAMTLSNLGNLYVNEKEYSVAETSYKIALRTWRELAAKNQAYLPNVAITLSNLGVLHVNKNEYPEAEASYEEALKMYRELADENRDAYLPDVARTLVNLSMFYQDNVPNKELSLKYTQEAIEVLGKCNHTPSVQENLDKAKQVIATWNNKK